MTYKKYRLIWISATIIVALLIGWSVASGYYWIPVPAIIVYFVITLPLRKRVKEVWYDERNVIIDLRAQWFASLTFIFLSVGSGFALLFLSLNEYADLLPIGLTLIGSGTALGLFYQLARLYISRKMGIKE
jgi:uncharacterized membrane protein